MQTCMYVRFLNKSLNELYFKLFLRYQPCTKMSKCVYYICHLNEY